MLVSHWGKQSQCNTETASEILLVVVEILKKVLLFFAGLEKNDSANIPETKTFPLKKHAALQ